MSAQPLMLTSPALLAEVAAVTRRAVDAWRARWGLDALAFDVDVAAADDSAGPMETAAGAWLQSAGDASASVLWPAGLGALVASTLYPRENAESASQASSLAAASVRHVEAELQRMLCDAWSIAGPLTAAMEGRQLSRWQAPVRMEIRLGDDLSIVALVSGQGLRRLPPVLQAPPPRLGLLDTTAFHALTSHAELIVGHASLPIPDLAALQVGDVIVLDARISDPLELRLEHGAATLRAAIGTVGPKRAAKIVSQAHS